jgi:hypothetical protein
MRDLVRGLASTNPGAARATGARFSHQAKPGLAI